MNDTNPFETIESALEFVMLLEQAVSETSGELEGKLKNANAPRSTVALRLALYKVEQLYFHIQKSRRILNDLSMIRRILTCGDIDEATAASLDVAPLEVAAEPVDISVQSVGT